MKKQPYSDLFFKRIKEYNKYADWCSHYVHLKDGNLMVIEFKKNHWEFDIVGLEEE